MEPPPISRPDPLSLREGGVYEHHQFCGEDAECGREGTIGDQSRHDKPEEAHPYGCVEHERDGMAGQRAEPDQGEHAVQVGHGGRPEGAEWP